MNLTEPSTTPRPPTSPPHTPAAAPDCGLLSGTSTVGEIRGYVRELYRLWRHRRENPLVRYAPPRHVHPWRRALAVLLSIAYPAVIATASAHTNGRLELTSMLTAASLVFCIGIPIHCAICFKLYGFPTLRGEELDELWLTTMDRHAIAFGAVYGAALRTLTTLAPVCAVLCLLELSAFARFGAVDDGWGFLRLGIPVMELLIAAVVMSGVSVNGGGPSILALARGAGRIYLATIVVLVCTWLTAGTCALTLDLLNLWRASRSSRDILLILFWMTLWGGAIIAFALAGACRSAGARFFWRIDLEPAVRRNWSWAEWIAWEERKRGAPAPARRVFASLRRRATCAAEIAVSIGIGVFIPAVATAVAYFTPRESGPPASRLALGQFFSWPMLATGALAVTGMWMWQVHRGNEAATARAGGAPPPLPLVSGRLLSSARAYLYPAGIFAVGVTVALVVAEILRAIRQNSGPVGNLLGSVAPGEFFRALVICVLYLVAVLALLLIPSYLLVLTTLCRSRWRRNLAGYALAAFVLWLLQAAPEISSFRTSSPLPVALRHETRRFGDITVILGLLTLVVLLHHALLALHRIHREEVGDVARNHLTTGSPDRDHP